MTEKNACEGKRCCCTCQWHIEDFHHCETIDRSKFEDNDCVCSLHKGWCCEVIRGRVYSGWSEHGSCELHKRREAK